MAASQFFFMFDISNITLLSTYSSDVQRVIDSGTLNQTVSIRNAFIRQIVVYFEVILPRSSDAQYRAISKAVVAQYQLLEDSGTDEWVFL